MHQTLVYIINNKIFYEEIFLYTSLLIIYSIIWGSASNEKNIIDINNISTSLFFIM